MMEITLLITLILTPLISQFFNWMQYQNDVHFMGGHLHNYGKILPVTHSVEQASIVQNMLRDLIVSLLLWNFYRMFRDIRLGAIFNHHQIRRTSHSGWCFITLSVYSIVSDMGMSILRSSDNDWHYYLQLDNLVYILIGTGLIVLAYVLQMATEIKEEQDMVI